MITKILQEKINALDRCVIVTLTDKYQFETNVRNMFIMNFLAEKIDFINKHKNYIGQEVYKFKKSFSFTTIQDYNDSDSQKMMNPIEEKSIVFSQDDYNTFCKEYINYQIEYFSKDLIKNKHYRNSTNPFSNLEAQWITECKQNLIEFLSEIKLS